MKNKKRKKYDRERKKREKHDDMKEKEGKKWKRVKIERKNNNYTEIGKREKNVIWK